MLQNYCKEMCDRRSKRRNTGLSFILHRYDSLWKTNGRYPYNDRGIKSWKCVNYLRSYLTWKENEWCVSVFRVCVFYHESYFVIIIILIIKAVGMGTIKPSVLAASTILLLFVIRPLSSLELGKLLFHNH